jgi:parvulin-like peptidyl-prolyl isomerase
MNNNTTEYQKKYNDEYYKENKDKIKVAAKIYYEKNKVKCKERMIKYRQENVEKIREKNKLKYQKNKELRKNKVKEYQIEHRKNPIVRFVGNLRTRVKHAIRNQSTKKASNTFKLIGCTGKEAFEYITSLLKPGMTWENYGLHGWHIDHILPCASFDLTDPEQQKVCFHYTNLQPLWAEDNLRKKDTVVS